MSRLDPKSGYEHLVDMLGRVRSRWRLMRLLRGLMAVVAGGVLLVVFSSLLLHIFRFQPAAVTAARLITWTGLVLLIVRFLLLPLLRRPPDERVALYIEEARPDLQSGLITAVEYGRPDPERGEPTSLVRQLVRSMAGRSVIGDYASRVGREGARRAALGMFGVVLLAVLLVAASPTFLGSGAALVFRLWERAEAASPYLLTVTPGDTAVARGSSILIGARAENFRPRRAEVSIRRGEGEWEHLPMIADETEGAFLFLATGLEADLEFYAEAEGVRSPIRRITVHDLAWADRVHVRYLFPAYTGLEPREQEGGDIASVAGTRVEVFVHPTLEVAGGRLELDGGVSIPLLPAEEEGELSGGFEVQADGAYRVYFAAEGDRWAAGSPEYLIRVLDDLPPVVRFRQPGADVRVGAVDEVFVETEAEDDFGVGALELVFSVNGQPEQTVTLYQEGGTGSREVLAGHTFFLEEWGLRPGDLVSYFARVTDRCVSPGAQEAATDIYFVEIAPFDRDFRQSQRTPTAGEQPPAGAGAGGAAGGLSRQQRDIIAATHRIVRDPKRTSAAERTENLGTVTLAQGQLAEQVAGIVEQMPGEVLGAGSQMGGIRDDLTAALAAMREAETRLGEGHPDEALGPEQQALMHLQRAEAAVREVQVAQQRQPGSSAGGAGGGRQQDNQDMLELLEMELDQSMNQYEDVQRAQQQQTDQQVDEVMQRLQELARRQQQENERRSRLSRTGQSASGMGSGQQQLAEETEQLARQLERLAREQGRTDLQESARRLREAAEQMRRSSASGTEEAGQRALERMEEARRLLDEGVQERLRRDLQDARRRADEVARQQRGIQESVAGLPSEGEARQEQLRRLLDRKESMLAELTDLEQQLDRMANESRREQPAVSREVAEAAQGIRDDKLKEKVSYSRGVVQENSPEYARNFEEQIAGDIERLRQRLAEADQAASQAQAGGSGDDRDLLERVRRLTEGVESLQQRTQQQGQPGQEGQPSNSQTARQFQREFQRRADEARQLARDLAERQLEVDPGQLERIAQQMEMLERNPVWADPRTVAELQERIVRDMKELEFALRRELTMGERPDPALPGSGEVPESYRRQVEEYYRSLARSRTSPPPPPRSTPPPGY